MHDFSQLSAHLDRDLPPVDPREVDLMEAIDALAELLEQYAVEEWARYFRRAWHDLGGLIQEGASLRDKAAACAGLREAIEGPGAFSEVEIVPEHHPIGQQEVESANTVLADLAAHLVALSTLYEEAD